MGEVTSRKLLFDLSDYIKSFSDGRTPRDKGNARISMDYYKYTQGNYKDEVAQFAQLEGDSTRIDTAVEWLLASYYSVNVRDIRPPEADTILPANNPKLAGLKLGAALYQDIQVLRFLDDTQAVGRYEGMLKFVCDKNGVTRAEIEKYYRDGIRGLIAEIVDEEFNKIRFPLDTDTDSCSAELVRKGNQYIIICSGYWGKKENREVKEFSGTSLDDLIQKMQATKLFSEQTATLPWGNKRYETFSTYLRAQAALIPAAVYADWKAKGIAGGVDGLALVKEALTNFYLNPNDNTYLATYGIRLRYYSLLDTRERDIFAEVTLKSYDNLIQSLSLDLRRKFAEERRYYTRDAQRVPNDPRFNIFSTPY